MAGLRLNPHPRRSRGCGTRQAKRDSSTTQTDAFAGSERGRKRSACSGRNDGVGGVWRCGLRLALWGAGAQAREIPPLRRPTRSQEANAEEKSRSAPVGMTVRAGLGVSGGGGGGGGGVGAE